MKGKPEIIAMLNMRLAEELTAIAQYEAHRALLAVQQYPKLTDYLQERIDDERKHFDRISERIRFLEGAIDAGAINAVQIGSDIRAIFFNDMNSELDAGDRYRESISLAFELGDHGTRTMLEEILEDEEDHLLDIEANLLQIEQMTVQNYLSTKN